MSGDPALMSLYQDIILKHNKEPQRKKAPEADWIVADGRNPTCGDEVKIGLKLSQADGDSVAKIEDVCFDGASCAICTASASMLVEDILGRSLLETMERSEQIQASLRGDDPIGESEGDLRALNGVQHFPVRLKCAELPWQVLDQALESRESEA